MTRREQKSYCGTSGVRCIRTTSFPKFRPTPEITGAGTASRALNCYAALPRGAKMGTLIPEELSRLQADYFVNGAALSVIGRDEMIRNAAKNLAESALRKLLRDCIKTTDDYHGHQGQHLHLDAYVLTPNELHRLVMDAREDGRRDAMQWTQPFTDA
jgi:hypothetical protein